MATLSKRLSTNVPGDFFVDSTCINCDTCRQLAPEIFEDAGEYSSVFAQPRGDQALRHATQALLACPTGSIGTRGPNLAREVMADFPMRMEDNVYYCGYNSEKSFGGNSYFVQTPEGNWLIDSPRFTAQIVRAFEKRGGIQNIFLTHRDDVADAHLYAKKFGARRIIHREELSSQPGAEQILEGNDPFPLGKEFLVIPTPGHTRGHCVLLYREKFLFTGDHLWWSRNRKGLIGSKDYCWYSWPEQVESMERLANFKFEWILPGHGIRAHFTREQMQREMKSLLRWMKSTLRK